MCLAKVDLPEPLWAQYGNKLVFVYFQIDVPQGSWFFKRISSAVGETDMVKPDYCLTHCHHPLLLKQNAEGIPLRPCLPKKLTPIQ